MKFPICSVCLKNEILCNGCAEKVGEKEIKKDEIKMFRRLNELLKKHRSLEDVEIKRAVGNKMLMIITRKGDVSRLIGKDGRIAKKIGKELNRPIRIIGQPDELRDSAEQVFFSVPILGMNEVFKPEGKEYNIRIPKSQRTNLPISSDIFSNVSKSLYDKDVDVVFE